jgi:hypothetical protein
MEGSRRRVLAGAAGLLTTSALAGCLDEAEEPTGDENGAEGNGTDDTATASVAFLVEGLGGQDDEHDHEDGEEHDDEEHDGETGGEHDDSPVTQEAIDEACGHMEFDDPESVEGSSSADDAPSVSGTHQPFEVSFDGDAGYVVFENGGSHDDEEHDDENHDDGEHDDENHDDGEHDDHSESIAFFARGGSVNIIEGQVEHADEAENCSQIDEYVVVELDDSHAVVELRAD